ncbi:tRNA lysidine(34) synthetase TilS [Metasolibacillus sp.]|uniref:tRNA lysidine(34) synthetase TilS n=1 Tax=Metasolibacillus sp. TaxID=2703680 RepID=UPI0025EE82F7|nr:tRNA lysidine(34) synthetase TilS [Metasolibacillus sp.]MCT6926010.1 tRNA lysidine(34) synthetase TilS [Metasolibacillus sp.]MCT6942245.1 tRNA lysidine(34) synthetase TilS [Metasolibacillus sp.]
MDSFEANVMRYIKKQQLVEAGDRLLIACSGGVDSMGLLYFFQAMRAQLQIEIIVAHVDHMLRGEASAADRAFVEAFCAEQHIPIHSIAIPIADIHEKEAGNLQMLCRRERYFFLEQIMHRERCTKLVTAHHADDQLETMLMALAKGATVNGLQGMVTSRPFAGGELIRPFLTVTKADIANYLQQCGGTYREDASNAKDTYTRNRFRHRIIPLLLEENPRIATHAVQLASQLQQDDAYLMDLAQEAYERNVKKTAESYTIDIHTLQRESPALQRRLILILLNYIYNDSSTLLSQSLLSSIYALFETTNGSATIHLPNHYMMHRAYNIVTVCPNAIYEERVADVITLNKWLDYGNIQLFVGADVGHHDGECYYFQSKAVSFPLHIRTRQEGDRIQLANMSQAKRLSRLFIDCKIPLAERDNWPLLVDAEDEVLAVLGVRVNNKFSKRQRAEDDCVLIVRSAH